ncbi:Rz1-like lysis system protein LysC [Shewanella electrica]|uniref:Rz1-like lysis system protein LysC n=1 Tax=Shewanella electrica TaxID=515560 RepID=UPI002937DEAB|nr:hypothetical protein [Shewanella electrica]
MLSGCSNTPPIVQYVPIETSVPAKIPQQLLGECVTPPYDPNKIIDNTDHTGYIAELLQALADCDMQWQRLGNYLQQQEHDNE